MSACVTGGILLRAHTGPGGGGAGGVAYGWHCCVRQILTLEFEATPPVTLNRTVQREEVLARLGLTNLTTPMEFGFTP